LITVCDALASRWGSKVDKLHGFVRSTFFYILYSVYLVILDSDPSL
jgi:hypothetical protein